MDIEKYVNKNQQIIDIWSARFSCLFYWRIRFVYDGEHWSQTMYDLNQKMAVIYPCDIEDEESWIIHEIIKLCFISCENDIQKKFELITDLVSIVTRDN